VSHTASSPGSNGLKRGLPVDPSPNGASPAALGVSKTSNSQRCRQMGANASPVSALEYSGGRNSRPGVNTVSRNTWLTCRGVLDIRRRSCAPLVIEDAPVVSRMLGIAVANDTSSPGARRNSARRCSRSGPRPGSQHPRRRAAYPDPRRRGGMVDRLKRHRDQPRATMPSHRRSGQKPQGIKVVALQFEVPLG